MFFDRSTDFQKQQTSSVTSRLTAGTNNYKLSPKYSRQLVPIGKEEHLLQRLTGNLVEQVSRQYKMATGWCVLLLVAAAVISDGGVLAEPENIEAVSDYFNYSSKYGSEENHYV